MGRVVRRLPSWNGRSCYGVAAVGLIALQPPPARAAFQFAVDGRPVADSSPSRAVTVADVIEMTTFGSQPHNLREVPRPLFSPDGREAAIVAKRGSLQDNTVTYYLLHFHTHTLLQKPQADTVVVMRSSSNRPGIANVTWLADSRTIVFLGEHLGEHPQVYLVDTRTRRLTQRTRHPTIINSFVVAPSGDPLVYMADEPAADTSDRAAKRAHGFVVRPQQFVSDLIEGKWERAPVEGPELETFVLRRGESHPLRVSTGAPRYKWCYANSAGGTYNLSIAPNGETAIELCARTVPTPVEWRDYTWRDVQKQVSLGSTLFQLLVLDLRRGTSRPLLDAPEGALQGGVYPTVAWAPDGRSVVLANAALPLGNVDSAERALRRATPAVAEVDVHTGGVTVIRHQDSLDRDTLDVVGWDATTNTIDLVPGRFGFGSLNQTHIYYQKTPTGWAAATGPAGAGATANKPLQVVIDEGMNMPPRLVAIDPATQRRIVVFDPNPQFAHLRWAAERVERWMTKNGAHWIGGLYLPPDYTSGTRYPLVIQTHGFDSTAFWPDGAFTSANAAQALAAHGITVLQLNEAMGSTTAQTSREAPESVEGMEAAIDHLDSLGLIDRTRVGLIGFSQTCYYVQYMLGHSSYPIAAASITDGVDYSYIQAMVFGIDPLWPADTKGIYGGFPFGPTLERWLADAPDFRMDRWTAPLRINPLGGGDHILSEWESYEGMVLQGKPVEMVVLPTSAHVMVKPWDMLTSEGGNADWFRFWLTGEEDTDPAKREQYVRWRHLRTLRDSSGLRTATASP